MAQSGDKFVLRAFHDNDYNEYVSWWDGEIPPKQDSLPKVGVVSGDMKAVGFIANTDCDFAILTFWYCNPKNKTTESHKAMKRIMQGLCEAAEIIGKKKVFCYTNRRGMIKLLESLNFINHDGHLITEFN